MGIAACGQQDRQSSSPTDSTCDGKLSGTIPTYITAWFHDSGANTDEAQILREQVSAFNATEQQVQVKLITLPVGDYAQQVQAAAAHGGLPDLLDFDGPNLYNYAWSGKLKPIDSCVSKSLREDLLPSIIEQGSYANRQWGVGTFDSGLGLYVRPSILMKAGIRIPSSPADAWTADEFTTVLQRLRQAGFERPLDLQLNEPNPEWYTYGFAPAVWSAGGDLIDRTDYRTVDGFLNGPGAVKAFTIMQRWFTQGYVDPNATGDAFEESRSPISWIGHWFYDRYSKAFPGDIRIVPLPNFGERTATDSGSWQWGITSNATDGDAVWRFLQFLATSGGSASNDARQRRHSRDEERRAHLTGFRRRWAQAPLHRAAGGRSRAITTADPRLSRAQRSIRTCIQRGGSPGTTRWCLTRCRRAARRA